MSNTSKQSRQNSKKYPEGTLAHTLSKQEAARHRKKVARRAKIVGAIAAGATILGYGAYKIDQMDDANKQEVAEQAAEKAIKEKRITGVDVNTNVFLREGVAVRTEPKIVRRTEEDRGNELFVVEEGKVLVISNPVNVNNDNGEGFMAFTLEDGRVGYVSNEVIGQSNADGERFAIVAPDVAPTYEDSIKDTANVGFDAGSGEFSLDGQQVGMGQIVDPEQALELMAS